MNFVRKTAVPVILATLWISISEFARNQFILNTYWTAHYESFGQTFPAAPVNGAVWGAWSLLFATGIFIVSKKFNLVQTVLLSWLTGFIMMWLVTGNLGVLPFAILPYAVPLSLLETFVAAWIIRKLS